MNGHPTLIIGIAGGAGSGKTTLSLALERSLRAYDVHTIHTDRFFRREKPTAILPGSGNRYDDFNHPDAVDVGAITDELDRMLTRRSFDAVIVEGFLLFHFASLREKLALKIFVDCPQDVRTQRRIDSFMKWGIQTEDLEAYAAFVNERHDRFVEPTRWEADIVVNGLVQKPAAERILASWIETKLNGLTSCTNTVESKPSSFY
ncbi:uridine kinase [Paenibacillus sp. MBLB4367]|uniref:uridine kinase family protein n=1 Tax=Paenibacillus sp. MBLB4367 TaxID=3384767 RepID=UPI00390818DB